MHVFIFRIIYLPAITFSHVKFRPSPTYWPTVCPPIYLCVYIHICMYLFLYLYIYLQSPAVILSSDPPQPIDLLSAYLFIYMYVFIYIYIYIYMYVCIYLFFIFIYLPAIICSHFKFRPSPTYWPTVCPPIYLCVYIHICMYLCLYLYIYLQSPAVILSSDPPQPIDLLSAYLFIYVYIYICIFYIYIFTCNHLQSS